MATYTTTSLATKPIYAVLVADDLDRAERFYHDTLGLEVTDMRPIGIQVMAGQGTRFLLYSSPVAHPSGNTVAGWIVDDLRSTVRELREHGVVFEEYDMPGLKTVDGIADSPGGPSAWFKDSEGNIINLAQM